MTPRLDSLLTRMQAAAFASTPNLAITLHRDWLFPDLFYGKHDSEDEHGSIVISLEGRIKYAGVAYVGKEYRFCCTEEGNVAVFGGSVESEEEVVTAIGEFVSQGLVAAKNAHLRKRSATPPEQGQAAQAHGSVSGSEAPKKSASDASSEPKKSP